MPDNSSSRRIDPSIIAALIGVIGTIIVTLITVNANKQPAAPTGVPTSPVISTNTNIPSPVPTDTVPAGQPTSTPAPATATPVPTFTLVPSIRIGQDWSSGCISTLWQPYPANVPMLDGGNGCWKQPVLTYSIVNSKMTFLYSRSGSGPVEIYGLFAPLPESGTAIYTINFSNLSNADILMGVFGQADVNSQGLLLAISNGNGKKYVIAQKDNVTTYNTLQSTNSLDESAGYSFTFTFAANSASGSVNSNAFVTNPVSIPSTQKWLFLGYKGLAGKYGIAGEFSGLQIK